MARGFHLEAERVEFICTIDYPRGHLSLDDCPMRWLRHSFENILIDKLGEELFVNITVDAKVAYSEWV